MASIIFRTPRRYGKRRGTPNEVKTWQSKRDKILLKIGFASYRDYLRGPLWKAIRAAKLAVDPKCEICNAEGEQVHHLSYNRTTLTGRSQKNLVTTCRDCHCRIEFCKDGRKRGFEASRKTAKRLLIQAGKWHLHVLSDQTKAGSSARQHTPTDDATGSRGTLRESDTKGLVCP